MLSFTTRRRRTPRWRRLEVVEPKSGLLSNHVHQYNIVDDPLTLGYVTIFPSMYPDATSFCMRSV